MDVDWPAFLPHAEQLGFGVVAGFTVGYALKKVGKLLAFALGLVFVVVQMLAYAGFVTVHWGEVQAQVEPVFDDGSLAGLWRRLVDVLTFNLTFAGAFVPALMVGLRKG